MKTEITIEYSSGESATYIAAPPEWAKWEIKTGKTIQQASEIGINDLMFLAYNAMKRSSGGKPIKPFEVWSETVADVNVGDANPKVIQPEASEGS
jgi:hypothetical protein